VSGGAREAAPRRGRSLFWTIAGAFLLALVVGTVGQALIADAVLRPLELREARARSELLVSSLAGELVTLPALSDTTALDSILEVHRRELPPRTGWLIWRGADGLARTAPPGRARLIDRPGQPPGPAGEDRRPQLERLETIAHHDVVRAGVRLGELRVVRPIWRRPPFDASGLRTSILFLPIGILFSALAGLLGVRWLMRRLRALEALAARVTEGDLTVRIADPSGDEIGRLAERLDRMTERLAEARDRIEATERQRRQLFADITHELATPLTSIRGYAETLQDPHVPLSADERRRYERGVLEEARRLDRLIRDLFELARLEAGASPLVKERLDWAALCRNTVERFEPRFRAAGLHLDWNTELREAWVEADGHRLEEVLENLLANALRYVPEGGHVELGLERREGAGHRFRLTVHDDGPGIPDEELPHVFERFYRGTNVRGGSGSSDDGGSGLGLAIVREIVERHGGGVSAETRKPRGLAIHVELPANL
jgi:signal transduction histidine kinase